MNPEQPTLRQLVLRNRMNDPSGDIAHHFALAGRVRTVYVNRRQHRELVSGTLAIVILDRRHHLIPLHVALKVRMINPGMPVIIAEQTKIDDGVPDDLLW